jgi:hypothetical protein
MKLRISAVQAMGKRAFDGRRPVGGETIGPKMFAVSRNLPARSSYIAYIRPTGTYSTVSKAPQADRLSDQIKAIRERAGRLPAGPERDELLRRAEQDEVALRVIQWVTSSGHLPPPSDFIPIARHRLHRK